MQVTQAITLSVNYSAMRLTGHRTINRTCTYIECNCSSAYKLNGIVVVLLVTNECAYAQLIVGMIICIVTRIRMPWLYVGLCVCARIEHNVTLFLLYH